VTPTPPPAGGQEGPLVIRGLALAPQPFLLGASLHPTLIFDLAGPAEVVQWRIYSRAFVVAQQAQAAGAFGPGWNQVAISLDGCGSPGTYFVAVRVRRADIWSKLKLLKIVVLR
jgi:hypothetical protein